MRNEKSDQANSSTYVNNIISKDDECNKCVKNRIAKAQGEVHNWKKFERIER